MPKTIEKPITVEALYKKVVELQRDITQIKKSLLEEPGLRAEFVERMRDIDLEKTVTVKDFGKKYGLK